MRRRKNFIPMLLLAFLSWLGLGYLVYSSSPVSPLQTPLPLALDPKLLFFLLFFLALAFSFSLLFQNTRRGFLVAAGITAFTVLRLFKLFHPLYIVLILALLFTTELYFVKK